jgi:hypothetical protein
MEVIGLEYGGPAERSGKVRVGDCKKIKVNQQIIYAVVGGIYRYIATWYECELWSHPADLVQIDSTSLESILSTLDGEAAVHRKIVDPFPELDIPCLIAEHAKK